MRDFHDKVAFVTGGASGLGFALARAFGRARMKVMLADIDVDALENAMAELKKDQISVRSVECDVSDRASVQHAAAETLAAFGKVHVVCNNAGVASGGAMELTTPGDCDWIIGVDLLMPFLKNSMSVAVVITMSLLACASAIAKPIPPREGCRAVSKIEFNAAKREYLLNSRARVYIRTGPFWRRHYWHCPV
jgi:NAD(P)-dependent dehydrogenase (short-subunit alcohol dehydrogenase family)